MDQFDAFSAVHDLPASATGPFQVVLDEMLSNVIRHGYGDLDRPREIEIGFHLEGGVLEVTFVDDSAPFDPVAAADPDTTGPLEDRPVGGLGIFMVKRLMDVVEYERREGRNRVVCRKRVEARDPRRSP